LKKLLNYKLIVQPEDIKTLMPNLIENKDHKEILKRISDIENLIWSNKFIFKNEPLTNHSLLSKLITTKTINPSNDFLSNILLIIFFMKKMNNPFLLNDSIKFNIYYLYKNTINGDMPTEFKKNEQVVDTLYTLENTT